jgi:hypothetical protein
MPVALAPERRDECCRDEKLKPRAAEEGEYLTAESKDQMAGLMDRKVEAVQPAIGGWCPQTLPSVDRQDQRKPGAPAPFRDRVVLAHLPGGR